MRQMLLLFDIVINMLSEPLCSYPKTDWIELDVAIRNLVKKDVLYLPPRAANPYLYGRTADTLLGIPLSAEDSEIAVIDGALKLLTSTDEVVKNLAWKDLTSVVAHRLQSGSRNTITPPQVTLNHLAAYLSGKSMKGSNPNTSIFTQARRASLLGLLAKIKV